jgi:5-methylcytosine-specific restriction endonuclease McrA
VSPVPAHLRHHYRTPEWKAARAAARERAGELCEGTAELLGLKFETGRCGAPNATSVVRNQADPSLWRLADPPACEPRLWREPIKVVLTTAHLDHDPSNNDLANLAVLCQRCHLAHDREQHAATRRWRSLRLAILEHGQEVMFPDRFPDLLDVPERVRTSPTPTDGEADAGLVGPA